MSEFKQLPNNIGAYQPGPLPEAPRPMAPFPAQSAEYPTYMPLQAVTIGSELKQEGSERQAQLFKPITIRGVTWPNRMWVAPMCMCKYLRGPREWAFLASMASGDLISDR